MKYEFTVPCMFGLEAVVKRELMELGLSITRVMDGRVFFEGDEEAIAKSNIWLRCGERVLLNVGEFEARTFEELYQGIKAIKWENYIPKNAKFWVKKATSIKSKVFSSTDIQRVVKKSIVDRLKIAHKSPILSETGNEYPIRIFIHKDKVFVTLDTSGEGLHKRGYRTKGYVAPIRETLAAAMIKLSPWKPERILVDPFCGSGTILIEAAMIGLNMAPGLNREFISENWDNIIERKTWLKVAKQANDAIKKDVELNLQGYDIADKAIKTARECAENAYVDEYIHLQERSVDEFKTKKHYGVVITNPPYGERLLDKEEVQKIYKVMGERFDALSDWSFLIITSNDEFERSYGKKASKNRKIYNGMLKSYIYTYLGPRPPRKN